VNVLSVYPDLSDLKSFHFWRPRNCATIELSSGKKLAIRRNSTHGFTLYRGDDVWLESRTDSVFFHRAGEIWINNTAFADWHGSFWNYEHVEVTQENHHYTLIRRRASGFFKRGRPFDVVDSDSARLGKITIEEGPFKSARTCGEYGDPDNVWLIAFLATYFYLFCLTDYANS